MNFLSLLQGGAGGDPQRREGHLTPFLRELTPKVWPLVDTELPWPWTSFSFISAKRLHISGSEGWSWLLAGLCVCRVWSVWCFVVVVQSSKLFWTLLLPWTAACQASLSLSISWSFLKFMSIASVIPSSHLLLWCSLSFCPQSFPASVTFPMSRLLASDDQNAGVSASASVLPTSIQCWFPLRLIALISLLSEGLSGVFSSTTVRRHQFVNTSSSLQSVWHAPLRRCFRETLEGRDSSSFKESSQLPLLFFF